MILQVTLWQTAPAYAWSYINLFDLKCALINFLDMLNIVELLMMNCLAKLYDGSTNIGHSIVQGHTVTIGRTLYLDMKSDFSAPSTVNNLFK